MTATQLYAPYGSVRYQSGILPTDFGFTHQRADATSGLDDYGARWYDPVAGQFASADTTLLGGLNRYAYVGGNPGTLTDPTGYGSGLPCPESMSGADCIQYYIAIVQFVISVMTNRAGGLPPDAVNIDTPTIQTIQADDNVDTSMANPFTGNKGMETLEDLGSLFNGNANGETTIGTEAYGEAPGDPLAPQGPAAWIAKYAKQSNSGKRSSNGNDDEDNGSSVGGTGTAHSQSGHPKKSSGATSKPRADANPFVRHGLTQALQGQFSYTDLRNAQFGAAPQPASSNMESPDQSSQSNPWQQFWQLANPCACGAPANQQPAPVQEPVGVDPVGGSVPIWDPAPGPSPAFGF